MKAKHHKTITLVTIEINRDDLSLLQRAVKDSVPHLGSDFTTDDKVRVEQLWQELNGILATTQLNRIISDLAKAPKEKPTNIF